MSPLVMPPAPGQPTQPTPEAPRPAAAAPHPIASQLPAWDLVPPPELIARRKPLR